MLPIVNIIILCICLFTPTNTEITLRDQRRNSGDNDFQIQGEKLDRKSLSQKPIKLIDQSELANSELEAKRNAGLMTSKRIRK